MAEALCCQWKFEPTRELPGGHCSRVYANADKVLKVPYKGEEMTTGYLAMVRLGPPLGPTIFESDPNTGSMLMDRAIPGTKLNESGISEPEQDEVWRKCALAFQEISTDGLMSMTEYYGKLDPLVRNLLATTNKMVALHGDLHHENILRNGDGWMCIDAKGLIGDPAVEGAAYVCNPMGDLLERSAGGFAERVVTVAQLLDVDPFRVWAWSIARMREDVAEPGEPWHHALVALNYCASTFGGERWVLPLA